MSDIKDNGRLWKRPTAKPDEGHRIKPFEAPADRPKDRVFRGDGVELDPKTMKPLAADRPEELDAEITRIFTVIDNYGTGSEAKAALLALLERERVAGALFMHVKYYPGCDGSCKAFQTVIRQLSAVPPRTKGEAG